MATKPEFLVAKEKILVVLATVSVAISSPDPVSFTGKCKNFTSNRKEIARKKLCKFAYFADTIQEMIFS